MATLEKVMQLKNQGMSDSQIINTLKQQGISPNEINNALNQAEIKNAVTGDYQQMPEQNYSEQPTEMQGQETYPQENYDQNYQQQGYAPQESYPPAEQYYPREGYDQNYQQQGYAPQEGYEQGGGGGFDSSTIMEIAEQVFSEKIKKIQNAIDDLNEFKTTYKTRIENIDDRLKKIESMIDKLQITIIEKVGSYGQNLGEIKKEMNMMQDTFGKMINNVADKNSSPITATKKKVLKE